MCLYFGTTNGLPFDFTQQTSCSDPGRLTYTYPLSFLLPLLNLRPPLRLNASSTSVISITLKGLQLVSRNHDPVCVNPKWSSGAFILERPCFFLTTEKLRGAFRCQRWIKKKIGGFLKTELRKIPMGPRNGSKFLVLNFAPRGISKRKYAFILNYSLPDWGGSKERSSQISRRFFWNVVPWKIQLCRRSCDAPATSLFGHEPREGDGNQWKSNNHEKIPTRRCSAVITAFSYTFHGSMDAIVPLNEL